MPKLPPAAQAWVALAALVNQADDDPDVATQSYRGPIPPRIFAAALLDLRARIIALEQANPKP
jgi:hypothetical protein